MKPLACLIVFLVLVELDQSEGFLKKLFSSKDKKEKDKKEDQCEIQWEEHTQPHCTTTYDEVSLVY
jgi:hypothetical protein